MVGSNGRRFSRCPGYTDCSEKRDRLQPDIMPPVALEALLSESSVRSRHPYLIPSFLFSAKSCMASASRLSRVPSVFASAIHRT